MKNSNKSVFGFNGCKVLEGHFSFITKLVWSPDGTMLASSSRDGTIQIWDSINHIPLRIIKGEANAISWSPESRLIAAGDNSGLVKLWDVRTGEKIMEYKAHSAAIYTLDWSIKTNLIASGSHDQTIRIWNANIMGFSRTLIDRSQILSVSWAPNGVMLASGTISPTITIWNTQDGKVIEQLKSTGFIYSILWSEDGKLIFSASEDKTIRIWNLETARLIRVLEGHTDQVVSISLSNDGMFLGSKSLDGNHKLWRRDCWMPVSNFDVSAVKSNYWTGLAFNPKSLRLACLDNGGKDICLWDLDPIKLLQDTGTEKNVHYINAKMVLVGDSGVGKSGLAIRLTEGRFVLTESTHAAKFWQIDVPKKILGNDAKNDDIQIELTLWDLAGQAEYRLVHQLFLDDTDAALLLFDCSDSLKPFHGVEYWAKVLTKQAPSQCVKLLVSSRCDVCPITVDANQIASLVEKCHLNGYFQSSAKTGEGVDSILQKIIDSIPWNNLTRTTTPILFKFIRDCLLEAKSSGEALISMKDLSKLVLSKYSTKEATQVQIDTVIDLLQSRGLIYRLNPTPKVSHILLKPDLINSYASSIILGARKQKYGLGSIPEREVICANIEFTGFLRLESEEEKIVLESAVELLFQHDLCFREMGVLIFPSQINIERPHPEKVHPLPDVSYIFSGSIEAIYASLVVRLSYTEHFQLEDRWKFSAEFSRNNRRLGFVLEQKTEDTSELGIYFTPGTDDFDRITFIRFITDHLHTKGLDVREHIRLYCSCGEEISNRDAINARTKAGKLDIPCQYCGNLVIIPSSIEEHYKKNKSFPKLQQVLEENVKERTLKEVASFQIDRQEYLKESDGRLTILHISDIHLGNKSSAKMYRLQLENDLKKELRINRIDYIVISGDVADKAIKDEYEAAFDLIDGLVKRFGLDCSRVIVVPGNHDVNWDFSEKAYDFIHKRRLPENLTQGTYINAGDVGVLVRDEELYKKRFSNFNSFFYKKISGGIEYPLEYGEQALLNICDENKIIFLSLNSVWNLDHHFSDRYEINIDALVDALEKIPFKKFDKWLKIFVLHNPIFGAEMLKNVAFLEQLSVNGFQICLHGHIHEAAECYYKYDESRGIHSIGAGTFGAPSRRLIAGIPFQYNILRINKNNNEIVVETRKKEKSDGAWSADARWGDKNNPSPRYIVKLN